MCEDKKVIKYLCMDEDGYGVGATIEEAYAKYEDDTGNPFKKAQWFELKPITVKMVATSAEPKSTTKGKTK